MRRLLLQGVLVMALSALGRADARPAPDLPNFPVAQQEPPPAPPPAAPAAFRQLPIAFQANQGQYDSQVKFVCRGTQATTFLTPTGSVLVLSKPAPRPTPASSGPLAPFEQLNPQLLAEKQAPPLLAALGITFAGCAAGGVPPLGVDRLVGRYNYFVGSDPQGWRSDVPSFRAVRYPNVWPGIDALAFGSGQQVNFDFVVAPGADVAQIRLDVAGAQQMTLDPQGNLVLGTSIGNIVLPAPVIYQESAGGRTPVSGRYVIAGTRVSFQVDAHDATLPLTIDPVLFYSTYFGGSGDDAATSVANDRFGFTYVAGQTNSPDFPATFTVGQLPPGSVNAFVAKFDPNGILVYSTYFGSPGAQTIANALAIQLPIFKDVQSPSLWIAGSTTANPFPAFGGPNQNFGPGPGSGTNAFVVKLSDQGQLQFATLLGGSGFDSAYAIALDGQGAAYVTGATESADFLPLQGAYQPTLRGSRNAFVTKILSSNVGSSIAYSTYFGGSGIDTGFGIAVGPDSQAAVALQTSSTDLPLQNPAQGAYGGGGSDAAVFKLNPAGGGLVFSTYLGGSGVDAASAIAVDGGGFLYVTGQATAGFPVANALQPTANNEDAFLAALDGGSGALLFSSFLGGSGRDQGRGIALGVNTLGSGTLVVAGVTQSADFPTLHAVQPTFGGGVSDAFVCELTGPTLIFSPNPGPKGVGGEILVGMGFTLNYSTFLGGSDADSGAGVAYSQFDQIGNSVVVVGSTSSTDFPVQDAVQPSLAGLSDAFLAVVAPLSTSAIVQTDSNGIAVSPFVFLPSTPGQSTILATATGTSLSAQSFSVNAGAVAQNLPAVTVTYPVKGMLLTTAFPLFTGTSSASDLTITLLVDGVPFGTTTSGALGAWALSPSRALPSGLHFFGIFATDGAGNNSRVFQTGITINPSPPVLSTTFPVSQTLSDLRPTLSARWSDAVSGVIPGTATITLDGVNVTSSATMTYGGFTLVPTLPLSLGFHTVVVQVQDGAGLLGTLSYSFSVRPPGPPAPPTGLFARAGNAQASLSWNVSDGATSYTLKRSTTQGGPYGTVQPGLAGTSATDSGLANGTTYYYVVTATSSQGEGAVSNEAFATPTAPPPAPTNVTASGRNTEVLLSWGSVPGAVSYSVKRADASGGPYAVLAAGLTKALYMDRGLQNGKAYYYLVSATNVAGEGPNSAEVAATPQAPPNSPSGLVAVPGLAQIALGWNGVSGVTTYDVLRAVTPGGPYTSIGNAANITYTDSGLTNGVAYFYVVRSVLGSGESGNSNEAYALPTLGPPAPSDVSVTSGSSQLTLTWTSSAGATSYRVKRSPTTGGPYSLLATVASPTFVDTGVTNGVAYYYVVTALGSGGESPPSAEVAGIPVGFPGSLVATPDPFDDVVLTWPAAVGPGVVGYNVYRSAQSGGPYTRLNGALLSQTRYTDSGLADQMTFFYVVRTEDISGREAGSSNEASATTYLSPIGFSGSGVAADSIDWTWYGTFDPSWTGFVLHDENERVIATVGPGVTDFVESGLAENTQYTRHVHPLTPSGVGLAGPSSPAYTLVHDPSASDFIVSVTTPGAVDFSVVPPPNAAKDFTGVEIDYSTDGVSFRSLDTLLRTYTFQESFLDSNTLYYFRIKYLNGDGFESNNPSPAKSIQTLGAPVFFGGSALSTSAIRWLWQGVPGAQGYALYDSAGTLVAQTASTSFNETGLSENTAYSRYVVTLLPGGPSGPSPTITTYTLVHSPGTGDFALLATSPNSVQVSVVPPPNPTDGFTGVDISRSLNGTVWTDLQVSAHTYTVLDAGLAGGTTYFYRIRFANGSGAFSAFGVFSASQSVQTPPGPPPAPFNFAGAALSTSQIHWTWSDVPGASGFVVHNDAHQAIGTVGAGVLAFDEPSLAENAATSRHVHALQGGFPGAASNPAQVYTLVHTPSGGDFATSVYSRDRIDVLVLPPPSGQSGSTGCEIQKLVGGTWVVARAFSNAYAFSDTGLAAGTAYQYRIRFRNGDGVVSDISPSQSASTFNLPPPVITTPSKRTRSATPNVVGTASPGETVTVFFSNLADGTAVADTNGAWFYTATPKSQGTYTVVAYGSSSGYSNSITIQVAFTAPAPPAPPTNIRAKSYSTATDLQWDPSVSPNVIGYRVYRKTGQAGTWTLLNSQGVILNTRYRDDGLSTGQTYFYRVTAVDNSVND